MWAKSLTYSETHGYNFRFRKRTGGFGFWVRNL